MFRTQLDVRRAAVGFTCAVIPFCRETNGEKRLKDFVQNGSDSIFKTKMKAEKSQIQGKKQIGRLVKSGKNSPGRFMEFRQIKIIRQSKEMI